MVNAGVRSRVMSLLARPAAARTAWGTADQVISSLGNFALGLLVMRTVDVRGFGVYSLLVAAYVMLVGSVRSVYIQPYTIRRGDVGETDHDDQRAAVARSDHDDQRAVVGGALVIGMLGAFLALLTIPVVGGAHSGGIIAFACTLPGLLVQDAYRLMFFALFRPRDATLNDLVWTGAQFAAAAIVIATGHASVATLVWCWGGGATVAAVYGYVQCRVTPGPVLAGRYLGAQRDLALPFLGEFWASYGIGEMTVYGMGAVASLETVGAFKAAALFMGPLNLLNNAVVTVALPELSRIRRLSVARVRQLSVVVGGLLAVAAVIVGGVVWLLPSGVGRFIAGPTWAALVPVVLPLALARAASGAVTGALLGTRVLEAAGRTLTTRLMTAPLIYGATLAGARYWDAVGAASGMAFGLWVAVFVWWHQFRLAEQQFVALQDEAAG